MSEKLYFWHFWPNHPAINAKPFSCNYLRILASVFLANTPARIHKSFNCKHLVFLAKTTP